MTTAYIAFDMRKSAAHEWETYAIEAEQRGDLFEALAAYKMAARYFDRDARVQDLRRTAAAVKRVRALRRMP